MVTQGITINEDKYYTQVHPITLDFYTVAKLHRLVVNKPPLSLDNKVEAVINKGAQYVQSKAKSDEHIYGVNTGFGSLCEKRINNDEVEELQYNHILSHAVGVGDIIPEYLSRFTMMIKLLTFRSGHTGITLETVNRMIDFWNHDVIPAIPQKGSVGASGDLAPLAHMALPLLGLGKVHYKNQIVDSHIVLEKFNWKPLCLKPKEGLALTNGVQYINGIAAYCIAELETLIKSADVIAALSSQAFSTSKTFYDPLYHETSLHEERREVASNLCKLLEGSNHWQLTTVNTSKQDPYSFRCIPQVHGAVRQTFSFAKQVIEKECNGVSEQLS